MIAKTFVLTLIFVCGQGALLPKVLEPLPLGTIRPTGWLRTQLEIQAHGLAGHLQRFWKDVQSSQWIGGTGDNQSELHERLPYWLNGMVPLVFTIPDSLAASAIRQEIEGMLEYILSQQQASGSLGPQDLDVLEGNWYWSKFDMIFALQYFMEGSPSNHTQVGEAIMALYRYMDEALDIIPLGNTWSGARWQDFVLGMQWMHDKYANATQQSWLVRLMKKVKTQGFKWEKWYLSSSFPTGNVPAANATLFTHGVNNAQAMKAGSVWYRVTGNKVDLQSSYQAHRVLQRYHGQATGMFTCDEHLAGRMPSHGSELCSVVESMFSYETMWSMTADIEFADQVERLAFNALPAELTKDMWAHQYLQEVNQFHARPGIKDHLWQTDGPDSIMFGLAPNYGCCTVNHDQGWAKFALSLLHINNRGSSGLMLSVFAPFHASIESFGNVSVDTDYPFEDEIRVSLSCESSYNFSFRVPHFVNDATLVTGHHSTTFSAGTFGMIACHGGVPMNFRIIFGVDVFLDWPRFNGALSVRRGSLLFGFRPDSRRTILRHYAFKSNDLEIENTTHWNFALILQDLTNVSSSFQLYRRERSPDEAPFATDTPSMILVCQGIPIPWNVSKGVAAAPPASPVNISNDAPQTTLYLQPYGTTDLRMAELPYAIQP